VKHPIDDAPGLVDGNPNQATVPNVRRTHMLRKFETGESCAIVVTIFAARLALTFGPLSFDEATKAATLRTSGCRSIRDRDARH